MPKPESKQKEILAALENAIKNGTYQDKLPPVNILADEFQINIRTLNKAVSSLVSRGLLLKKRGIGTFIKKRGSEKLRIQARFFCKDLFHQEVWRGISHVAEQAGCELFITNKQEVDPDYDGYIFMTNRDMKDYKNLLKNKIPFVVLEDIEDPEVPCVATDVYPLIYRLIRKMIKSGLRHVAYIGMTSSRELLTDIKKFHSYLEATDDELHGIDFSMVRHVWPEPENGYKAMKDILLRGGRPDAVFVSSDIMVDGVVRAAYEHMMEVPKHIQILGCDGINLELPYKIASVNVPRYEMGITAMQNLLDTINEPGKRIIRKNRLEATFTPGDTLPIIKK